MSFVKIFQRSRGCIMYLKFVQTDQGYQSHQLLSDLNSYRRWYWLLFKTAGNPTLKILRNMTKKTKYSFWLQKVVKNQSCMFFKHFRCYLFNNLFFLFDLNLFWRIHLQKSIFLYRFVRKHEKMAKYSFRLQIGVKIQNLIIQMCPRPKNKGGFIYQNCRQTSGTYL